MLTINTDRTNMIRTSCNYCDAHAAATAAITDFAPTVTKVKNKLVLIDALNTIATGTSKGVTLDTNAIRKVMEVDTDKVCSGLKALAGDTNNNTMYEAANYTEAKLSKLRKDEVDDICEGIYNLAFANKVALVAKGIVTADITDTLTAIGLYRIAEANPRAKIIDQKNANDQIEPMIRNVIDNILIRQLDQLATTLKTSNNNFYTGYFIAREIVNTGASSTRIKGLASVKGVTPAKPIYNVFVKLTDGTDIITFNSAIDGAILYKSKAGVWQGQATCDGFDVFTVAPFDLKTGKTFTLDIEMTPTV